ncbi:MAG: hypothetical protein H0V17_17650 [Deltaproteobacteria bacterium]|nr:hypothetical protein [Deltaproteobacteria bacterium]
MRSVLLLALAACSYSPQPASLTDLSDGPSDSTVEPSDSTTDAPEPSLVADPFTSGTTVGFSNSLTFQHEVGVGANRILLVGISISFAGSLVTSVTYGAAALTRAGAINAPSSDGRVEIWALRAPASGAASVLILLDDASSTIVAGAVSFSGVDPATPLGPFNSASASSGDPSITVATTAGEVAFGVVMWNGGDYSSLSTAQQQAWNKNGANVGSCCSIVGASALTTAVSPTLGWVVEGSFDDFWAIGAVAIRPD